MTQHGFRKIILDTLFPLFCLGCGKEGFWVCERCSSKIRLKKIQICPICEREEEPLGSICRKCREKYPDTAFNSLIVASEYDRIAKIVHLFKYKFIPELASPLGSMLVKSFIEKNLPLPDLIVPVPIHRKRLRWRGFNQSELLGKFLSENIAPGITVPVLNECVIRKRYASAQMKIGSYQERINNMKDSFMLNRKYQDVIRMKRILLVDDVVTTGATIAECAKEIRKAEPKEIHVMAIARQGMG
ncbi:MAG: ComF family protein [Candidatus Moranbacteria bacterium]|nr:ComF family protein [Candidatus Moranbacteria bacterium]